MMVKSKILYVIIISIFTLPLSGCWDTNEPETLIYAHGFGIDYKDGLYTVYAHLLDLGGSEQSQEGNKTSEMKGSIVWNTGKDINEAVFNITKTNDQRIFWGHLVYLVFTKEALESGALQQMVDGLERHYETRYHIWIYSTKEPLSNLFQISTDLAMLTNPLKIYEQNSLIKPLELRELAIAIEEPGHEATIPVVRMKKNSQTSEPIQLTNTEFNGVAFITPKHLKGSITEEEVLGLRWMTPKTKNTYLEIVKNQKPIASIQVKKVKPIITSEVKNDKQVTFHIKTKIIADISGIFQQVDATFLENEVKKLVEKEIRTTYLAALKKDADVYRLSEEFYRKDIKSWKKVSHKGKIPLDEHSIDSILVEVKFHNSKKLQMNPSFQNQED